MKNKTKQNKTKQNKTKQKNKRKSEREIKVTKIQALKALLVENCADRGSTVRRITDSAFDFESW
jgi:hypothetical protein